MDACTPLLGILLFAQPSTTDVDDFARAWGVLVTAREAMGLEEPGFRTGRLVVEGVGTLDYDARDQGMAPGEPHVVSNRETVAFDFRAGRAVYEYQQPRADGSVRWRREDYLEPGRFLEVGLTGRWAELSEGPNAEEGRLRVLRRLPHYLVREAIERRATLQWRGIAAGGVARVAYALPDGTPLTMGFDTATHHLVSLEVLEDQPLRGDVEIRWEFLDYRPVTGFGSIPHRYRILVGDDVFVDVRAEVVDANDHPVFELPEDIPMPAAAPESEARAIRPEVLEVQRGIFMAKNVRIGINAFFADMGDFVLVYDAPAGYRLIDQIPPGRLAPGSTSNSVTETLMELVARTLPDKPIRLAVISHYHSDHLGGVRAYAREDIEIVIPLGIESVVERALAAPHRLAEGVSDEAVISPTVSTIDGRRVIQGSSRNAEIHFIGDAPHASSMLVVRFPDDGVMLTGDLFYPSPLRSFPSPNREPIMRFFVDWLDTNGFAPDIVLASHAPIPGTREHLDVIRRLSSP